MATFDAFIGYIIPKKCPTYSVIVETVDGFYDVDASDHFLHIPIKIGIGYDYDNQVQLTVKATEEDDEFQAIPFCLWKQRPAYRSKYLGINMLSTIGANNNIFHENKVEWLGPTSKIEFKLSLSVDKEPNIDKSQPNFDLQCLKQDQWFTKIERPNFDYRSNSWFVAYTLFPYNTSNQQGLQRISYRICDKIKIFHHGNQEKFNFFRADEKIYKENQIMFYKKIYTVWDWLYCIRMLKHYNWATYNYHR